MLITYLNTYIPIVFYSGGSSCHQSIILQMLVIQFTFISVLLNYIKLVMVLNHKVIVTDKS